MAQRKTVRDGGGWGGGGTPPPLLACEGQLGAGVCWCGTRPGGWMGNPQKPQTIFSLGDLTAGSIGNFKLISHRPGGIRPELIASAAGS